MPLRRVTIQDIADACGLSRNTVSKVFNDRGAVQEATRLAVLKKARELGYLQLPGERDELPADSKSIALLTQRKPLTHDFGVNFITSFTDAVSRSGYTLKMYEVSAEEMRQNTLPPHLNLGETAGILGIELFAKNYLDMVSELRKPTVFVDGYARVSQSLRNFDLISMENTSSELALVNRMIEKGARRIGFVGDKEHCNSFLERWWACVSALGAAGLTYDPRISILEEDGEQYADTEWLLGRLDSMPQIPDAFACANDFLAIRLMAALKKKGLRIPQDVMVAGFDGSAEASVVEPSLTTVRIPGGEIGRLAASTLFERIRRPDASCLLTYVKTVPVWGGSTG